MAFDGAIHGGEPPLRAALGGMAYHVVPVCAKALDLRLHAGPLAVADLPVEELDARDARIAQSVEVGVESRFRHVPADQVEPRLGTMRLRRILERGKFDRRRQGGRHPNRNRRAK